MLVYLRDISSNILPGKSTLADIFACTQAHILKLRHPPLRDSVHGLMGYSIKRPLLKGTEEERVRREAGEPS